MDHEGLGFFLGVFGLWTIGVSGLGPPLDLETGAGLWSLEFRT